MTITPEILAEAEALAYEAYDRFVMGGWEASEFVDTIATALAARDARGVGWQSMSSAPSTPPAIWLANSEGMEPCHRRFSKWKNCYTDTVIDWEPTHWMPLPEPPK